MKTSQRQDRGAFLGALPRQVPPSFQQSPAKQEVYLWNIILCFSEIEYELIILFIVYSLRTILYKKPQIPQPRAFQHATTKISVVFAKL